MTAHLGPYDRVRPPTICLQHFQKEGVWSVFEYGKGTTAEGPTAEGMIAAMRMKDPAAPALYGEYLLRIGCKRGDHAVLDAILDAGYKLRAAPRRTPPPT